MQADAVKFKALEAAVKAAISLMESGRIQMARDLLESAIGVKSEPEAA